MRLRFALSEINQESDHFEFITRIMGTIADGWHEWIDPPPDAPVFAAYFGTHRQYEELALKSFSQAVAYSNPDSRTVVIVAGEDEADFEADHYPLKRALDYLAQPLRILVENEVADGHFYLRYIRAVDPDLAKRFEEARPPAMFDQGGGKMEVVNLVTARVARATKDRLRIRLAVIVDSDSRYPGHLSAETLKLIKVCGVRHIPVHATWKRAQENYLPDGVFRSAAEYDPNLQNNVEFILALSPEQRNHYPIKSGLPENLSDGERNLYIGMAFPAGSKPKVHRIAEFFRTKCEFELELDDLVARSCLDEFQRITEFIRREL